MQSDEAIERLLADPVREDDWGRRMDELIEVEAAVGRPVVFTKEKKDQVVLLLRSGCSKRRAASYVGVAESTIRRAELEDPAFGLEMNQAGVQFEVDLVVKMRAQASQSWRAAAWLLERRLPEDFGRTPARERTNVGKTRADLMVEMLQDDPEWRHEVERCVGYVPTPEEETTWEERRGKRGLGTGG